MAQEQKQPKKSSESEETPEVEAQESAAER